ncbi:ABC transporter permease [Marivibrio halodurans]|uniref:ABC transporter permease n=1 Tax=Marivibrio halodurans TaxID=2039722 RepID=A0A8J7V2J9_9PROT|nr:ABC transporter permease [Marivibrio halodurans]MBP5856992.1 ABC transporter permease [Marivibrio halodurans]
MKSHHMMKLMIGFYIVLFFGYLFGPLIIMSITAFNSSDFPRVSPWDCFTLEWFPELRQDRFLVEGFQNSLVIGAGVIALAVPIGLAGALLLTQLGRRARSGFYTLMISPILVPGVVLGISTIIFWRRMGEMIGVPGEDNFLYEGIFMTILGQSTFISAFTMLVFVARLQRFDPAQEEAALDLGATKPQAFRKVLLPFLKPAIGSAAVLAFLASFENYNTTVFTILQDKTLTTVLASKVRYGIDPSISALAVLIVSLTLVAAFVYEVLRRREQKEAREIEARARAAERLEMQEVAQGEGGEDGPARSAAEIRAELPAASGKGFTLQAHHLAIVLALIAVAGIAKLMLTDDVYAATACKEEIRQEKLERQQELLEKQRQLMQERQQQEQGEKAPRSGDYQSIFDPGNLQGDGEEGSDAEQAPEAPATSDGQSSNDGKDYQSIFDPGNLQSEEGN